MNYSPWGGWVDYIKRRTIGGGKGRFQFKLFPRINDIAVKLSRSISLPFSFVLDNTISMQRLLATHMYEENSYGNYEGSSFEIQVNLAAYFFLAEHFSFLKISARPEDRFFSSTFFIFWSFYTFWIKLFLLTNPSGMYSRTFFTPKKVARRHSNK